MVPASGSLTGKVLAAVLILSALGGIFLSQSGPIPVPDVPSVPPPEPLTTTQSVRETFSLSGTEQVSILLIGHDGTEEQSGSRADAILLCTIDKSSNRLIMTSFLRDLYVPIPGHGENRLNAAYAFGGKELLLQTLEETFGIHPDGALEVDFSGFSETIDILGGVTLEISPEEAAEINRKTGGILAGVTQLLSGPEALAYVRIRKLDDGGDFSRTARQQKLLQAMLRSCKNLRLSNIISLIKQGLDHASTDIPKGDLLRLALEVLPILDDLSLTGLQIPQEGAYSYETVRGMSVLIPDLEAARTLLRDTLGSFQTE